jgi:hypothetical protein
MNRLFSVEHTISKYLATFLMNFEFLLKLELCEEFK